MKKSQAYLICSNVFCIGTFASDNLFEVIFCSVLCVFYVFMYIRQTKMEE